MRTGHRVKKGATAPDDSDRVYTERNRRAAASDSHSRTRGSGSPRQRASRSFQGPAAALQGHRERVLRGEVGCDCVSVSGRDIEESLHRWCHWPR